MPPGSIMNTAFGSYRRNKPIHKKNKPKDKDDLIKYFHRNILANFVIITYIGVNGTREFYPKKLDWRSKE